MENIKKYESNNLLAPKEHVMSSDILFGCHVMRLILTAETGSRINLIANQTIEFTATIHLNPLWPLLGNPYEYFKGD